MGSVGPARAGEAANALPAGLKTHMTPDGLALADGSGRPVYRLDLDRYRARRRGGGGGLIAARCAGVCDKLWRPIAPPADFKPDGDWGVEPHADRPAQLTYKGDPLYSFQGKSLDEAAALPTAPPYFSSYAAKPALMREGVPIGTVYWHAALYAPPAPKTPAPAGVTPHWSKTIYVFAAGGDRELYVRQGGACDRDCDGLEPLPAPLAALAVGDWRPVEGKDGARLWSYRGRIVYRQAAEGPEPGGAWQALEVR